MFEKFTAQAREVVVGSQERAGALGHQHIGTEHLLLALLRLPDDAPARLALDGVGLSAEAAEAAVLAMVPRTSRPVTGHIPFTPRARRVLELSLRESQRLGSAVIGPEHLLLSLLEEPDGIAAKVLLSDGRTEERVRSAVATATGVERAAAARASADVVNTPATERVLELAAQLAGGAPVGSQHLLEALAWVEDGVAGKVLHGLGVTRDSLAEAVDGVDLDTTADLTPELSAAARLRLTFDGEKAVLTSSDPTVVAVIRQLVDEVGELSGDGPLAGSFVPLHRALLNTAAAVHRTISPPADTPEAVLAQVLRARLKRRQNG
ncbi:Clp protease N-terminal domain-containing protein [Pseudonocardia sp. CA-107938]|uniref:Clp protease N-terminal domain-containing protein n=1 Tax=Pseudonocardia sp. CA-107938 TaxID=3240021 RepID=UPI003D8C2218